MVLDGLPGLYGFMYDRATACGLPLYFYSYKLVGSVIEWPQGAGPTTQTSVEIEDEDVDWAVLGAGEEAATLAAGKRPTAPKQSKKRSATTLLIGGGAKYQ